MTRRISDYIVDVGICISGSAPGFAFDPDDATRAIGLFPDDVTRHTDLRPSGRGYCPFDAWNIGVSGHDFNTCFRELLDRIMPFRDRIRIFAESRKLDYGVGCTVRLMEGNCLGMVLSADTMRRLGELDFPFSVEFYDETPLEGDEIQ